MAVAEILDPQPGERILDLAAAPGGKSTHIVSLMRDQGLLIANEIRSQRVWELAENLERWGATNTIITQESPARLAIRMEGYFDRVLVDAPCSGEGMFRKSENARRDWSPELVMSCSLRQKAILHEAARMVRPGGVLVYSTCTFSEEENEMVISNHLSSSPDFELEDIELAAGLNVTLPGTLLLMPHKLQGEGHFVAKMRRKGGSFGQSRKSLKPERLQASALKSYQEFCRDSGIPVIPEESLRMTGSYLYKSVESAPDLSTLRIIHPGFWLGTIHHSEHNRYRFEPAHAFALALKPDLAQHISLVDRHEVVEYLKGIPISHPGPDGWVLVCMNQYPLGWGKRVKGVIKNFYPKGLRWQ